VARHDQLTREFAEAAATRERELEERLAAKLQESERQASETRVAWEAEKRRWREDLEVEKADKLKAWVREQEEHEYTWKLRRNRDEEEHKVRHAALLAQLGEEKARAEQQLSERERLLADREGELADLRARVAAHPAELSHAVQPAGIERPSHRTRQTPGEH
jgi:hypothetical protein